MRKYSLKSDLYTITPGSSTKRNNLNIDDLIYQFKMRKCNSNLAKQYSEIIKIFDNKPTSATKPPELNSNKLRSKLRLRTDESTEPFQGKTSRLSQEIDIQKIINETSPIKITPRLNYENFKTFQGIEQLSTESNYQSTSLAKFGPLSSNQCETDEEIQQIMKQSVQKLTKFEKLELEQFEQNILNAVENINNKNNELMKKGFHIIKIFSKWTLKEKATKQLQNIFEHKFQEYFSLLQIYEPSIYGSSRNSVIEDNHVLQSISLNVQTFNIPILKPVTNFGAMNFEEYLKKKKINNE